MSTNGSQAACYIAKGVLPAHMPPVHGTSGAGCSIAFDIVEIVGCVTADGAAASLVPKAVASIHTNRAAAISGALTGTADMQSSALTAEIAANGVRTVAQIAAASCARWSSRGMTIIPNGAIREPDDPTSWPVTAH